MLIEADKAAFLGVLPWYIKDIIPTPALIPEARYGAIFGAMLLWFHIRISLVELITAP